MDPGGTSLSSERCRQGLRRWGLAALLSQARKKPVKAIRGTSVTYWEYLRNIREVGGAYTPNPKPWGVG